MTIPESNWIFFLPDLQKQFKVLKKLKMRTQPSEWIKEQYYFFIKKRNMMSVYLIRIEMGHFW